MFVSDIMSKNVKSVRENQSPGEVLETMRELGFEAIPVTSSRGNLRGIITEHDLLVKLGENPSQDFLDNGKIQGIMAQDVVTVGQDEIIESACYIMRKHDFSALPVVDEKGNLTGIITQSDIFSIMVDMMGLTEPGTRITLVVPDRVGVLADIASTIKQSGISIASVAALPSRGGSMVQTVFRIRTIDADAVVQNLMESGFRVVHVSQVWE